MKLYSSLTYTVVTKENGSAHLYVSTDYTPGADAGNQCLVEIEKHVAVLLEKAGIKMELPKK